MMEAKGLNCPEINEIQNFIVTNGVETKLSKTNFIDEKLIPLELIIGIASYVVQVADEYDDLIYNNPLLNCILVFRELALIDDSSDFLIWCQQNNLDVNNNTLLSYYKNICNIIEDIRALFPDNSIHYFVSDLGFQLNSGVIQLLRK